MPEYKLSYRLYGPVNIQSGGEIRDAVLQPRSDQHSVEAVLEFTTDAADPDEAAGKTEGTKGHHRPSWTGTTIVTDRCPTTTLRQHYCR